MSPPPPRPGWTPPQGDAVEHGECMRQALACLIGEHPNDIAFKLPDTSGRAAREF